MLIRFIPQRRLGFAAAALAPLWLVPGSSGEVIALGAIGVLVLATALDILLLPANADMEIAREVPGTIGMGDAVEGQYTITNRAARAFTVALSDQLPALVTGGISRSSVHVPGNAAVTVDTSVTGASRGVAPLGLIGARVTGALGFVAMRIAVKTDDRVRVIPSLSGVQRFRLMAMQNRLNVPGARVLRLKGQGQSFASLREYVRGDDPRHIDWKATSKKAKMMVREFTVERSQTVITLIDAGRGMTQLSGTQARFEYALRAALILTDIAATAGDRVGTLVFDDETRAYVPPQGSRAALQLVRDAFIPVMASPREPDYATAFRFLAAHQRKRALIVFFTDVIDVRASQALLAYVNRSAARHLVLVAALRNDSVFDAARPRGTETPERLYENAAAEEVIQAREEVLERMRRAGVIVLDVSPQTVTAGVVNRYLELKARGAL